MSATASEWELGPGHEGARLDVVLNSLLEDVSRSRIQKWIGDGLVTINDHPVRTSHRCRPGDRLRVRIPEPVPAEPVAEPVPLDIVFEDADILVLNKRAGMVVHPAPGHTSGTLVNGLLHHCRDLSGIGDVLRPGIVHRLDRGTSGVMVVAKTQSAHLALSEQFQNRTVQKYYMALVYGRFPASLTVDSPLGRDRKDRKKISSRTDKPRAARSEASLLEAFSTASLLSVRIYTGRTHQIRVHLSEAGFPVVGDTDYPGGRRTPRSAADQGLLRVLEGLKRPALHSHALIVDHPTSGHRLRFETPLPEDLRRIVDSLRSGDHPDTGGGS